MNALVTPIDKTVVFRSPWFSLEEIEMASRGGKPAVYHRVVDAPGVICVVFSAEGDFVMVRQPRPVIERFTLEFPAGRIDAGETREEAARREVLEETGLALTHLAYLGQTEPIPSRMQTPQALFVGVTAPGAPKAPDGDAELAIIPRGEFLDAMKREGMNCLCALGALKIAELTWQLDLFKAPIAEICRQFSKESRS